MKTFTTTLFLVALLSVLTNSYGQITVSGEITGNVNWDNANVYLLNGFVYVRDGAELHIPAGTLIKGDLETQGTLIVERGGKIFATGTASQPIVFTSNQPIGERYYGDWGGVIVCGRASINVPGNAGNGTANGEAIIEGGVGSIYGGGANANDDDNSGVIQYVRIEYGGIAYQPNSEINGLTLAGVGRGTTIDHVQVSYCGDDAFEFFGGTVNCSHLFAYRNWDDDFDTDFGYRGKVQFAISVRDRDIADQSGSNGFESDNDGQSSTNTPLTNGIFSNVTIIGPMTSAVDTVINANYRRALHLRRNTGTSIFNSVFTGYRKGLVIDGSGTLANASSGFLRYKNNVLCAMEQDLEAIEGTFNIDSLFSSGGNESISEISSLLFTSTELAAANVTPQAGSPILSGADFSDAYLNDAFFEPVTFRGAIGSEDWTAGWKSLTPDTNPYTAGIPNSIDVETKESMFSMFPNPTNEKITIQTSGGTHDIVIFNLMGEMIWSNKASSGTITVNTSAWPQGIYTVVVSTDKGNCHSEKLSVIH